MAKEIIVEFEKIGEDGVSIGKFENKIVFAYGVLPEEIAKIRIIKKKKDFIEGEVIEIIKASKHRVPFKENHYLSCSPWQVFEYNYQIELKKSRLKEIFLKFSHQEIEINQFFPADKIFGYRTKIEYSFLENEKVYLAFHKRGSYKEKLILENGCILMDEKANQIALKILEEINKQKLKNLKTLIIRQAKRTNDLHISLLVKDQEQKFNFSHPSLTGFIFAYSDPKSPASVFTKILYQEGREYLIEKILNLEFRYSFASFFQNNVDLFENALKVMREHCQDFYKIVDLYCGVGVIGLSLKDYGKEIMGVDIDQKAILYAKLNAELNGIKNFKAITLPSEKIPKDILEKTDLLLLDPPRPGLHPKLIKIILETQPENIFYLSCNPITQARDFFLLKSHYKILAVYGFDFYPNTPHIESLLILKKHNIK